MPTPKPVQLNWTQQYRIVSSEFPPINFFEQLVDPDLMDELYYIESLTNERLRHEAGDIAMVPVEDRISGPGSSPVMAAFTHISINRPSRFSYGNYGVYYAAKSLTTAIEETKFHRAIFLAYTNEEPGEIDMRVYTGKVIKPMHDIRMKGYESLHNPDDWTAGQAFGQQMHESRSWGLVYNSVRDQGGQCIAVFRPPGISVPVQGAHLSYVWNGSAITDVFEKSRLE